MYEHNNVPFSKKYIFREKNLNQKKKYDRANIWKIESQNIFLIQLLEILIAAFVCLRVIYFSLVFGIFFQFNNNQCLIKWWVASFMWDTMVKQTKEDRYGYGWLNFYTHQINIYIIFFYRKTIRSKGMKYFYKIIWDLFVKIWNFYVSRKDIKALNSVMQFSIYTQ